MSDEATEGVQTGVLESLRQAGGVRLDAVPGGRPDLDQPIREAMVSHLQQDRALRLRIPIFYHSLTTNTGAGWRGVTWAVDFSDVELAIQFRDDLGRWIRTWIETRRNEAKEQG